MSHDYDAKHTLRQILFCRAYQAPVVEAFPRQFREPAAVLGPTERRLTSEQFLDAVAQLTGYWPSPPAMAVRVENPHIRAWRYKKPDALATALGRPNREQVCTERNEDSTVLQELELINGEALAGRLREGANHLLASDLGKEKDPARVIQTLYRRALGRLPTSEEQVLAQPLLGNPANSSEARRQGWEDFLWTLVVSPEFQFIR
jgi:hypothetical protein